jgi:hypothetical protein
MIRWISVLLLAMHGVGHGLFLANSWGMWKTNTARAWLFDGVLHIGQTSEGVIGVLWVLPLIGFLLTAVGMFTDQAWWRSRATGSAVLSGVMIVLWWNSLNPASAFFALAFNVAVLAVVLWQRQPQLMRR